MEEKKHQNLWGGRFQGAADPAFAEFNRSFDFDRRLFSVDVRASIAHCDALAAAGVLDNDEARTLQAALLSILDRGRNDAAYLQDSAAEDVHSFVEARLVELAGDLGRKLHTGRSRNDQVATDFRLWLREQVDDTMSALKSTQTALLDLAETNSELV